MAYALLSITILAIFTGTFLQVNNYINDVGGALQNQIVLEGIKARTNIEIANVSQDSYTHIYVENTGSEILDPDKISLFVNGALVSEDNYWPGGKGYITKTTIVSPGIFLRNETRIVRNTSNQASIIPESYVNQSIYDADTVSTIITMTYTNTSSTYYFEPSDVIELVSDYATLSTGDKVKVSVENGIFDSITLS